WSVIERCLRDGINVNVTLVFSPEDYRDSIRTYLRALEGRVKMGQPLDRVASAASFFVRSVDTEINRCVDGSGRALAPLRSLVAIANAWLIHATYIYVSESARWKMLEVRGARLQRPLWACVRSQIAATLTPPYLTYGEW